MSPARSYSRWRSCIACSTPAAVTAPPPSAAAASSSFSPTRPSPRGARRPPEHDAGQVAGLGQGPQRADDGLLADQVLEALRAQAARQRRVGRGRPLAGLGLRPGAEEVSLAAHEMNDICRL